MIESYVLKSLRGSFKESTVCLSSEDKKIAENILSCGERMSIKQLKYIQGLYRKGSIDSFLCDGDLPDFGYDPYSVQEVE